MNGDDGWDWSGLCDGKGGWIDPIQPITTNSPQSDNYNAALMAEAHKLGYAAQQSTQQIGLLNRISEWIGAIFKL